jgi:MoaA/NifB/PqqE/SkfB family radical SAM enzyme
MKTLKADKPKRMHPAIDVWRNKSLKAFLNILKATIERRRRKVDVQSIPFVLYYEPTSFCNLKCPSCPTGVGILDRPKERVDPEQFKATVDAMADQVFVLYMYNWGEPLLHREFSNLVKYATDKGIVVKTSSNLSIPLSDTQLKGIVESGLQQLKVGIDGATPEVHEMYRRRSNLELVHKNVRAIAQYKKELKSSTPEISVTYHVFAHNEAEIEEFKRQMPELGVNHFSASPSWLPPDESVLKAKDPQYDAYKLANETISELRSQGTSLKPCGWLYYASVINPGGTISPCCGVVSESSDFGQLPESGGPEEMGSQFRAEWNGKKYTASRKLFGKDRAVEKWSEKNLRELEPDGMAFSQINRKLPLICANCPIPHTLERWTQEMQYLYSLYRHATKRSILAFNIPGIAMNATKALILRLAIQLQ